MTYAPTNFLVWGELPVTDLEAAKTFYSKVVGTELEIDNSGPNPMVVFRVADDTPRVALHLYVGKPAKDGSGPTLHLAAEGKLEDVMTRVKEAGGTALSPAIPLPQGRFFYAQDLDGNSVGFFETPE